MSNLSECLVEWSRSPLLVFLQEPWTSKTSGRIRSLPRGTQVFSANHPRAAILATPELKLWEMPELTTQDVASCLWKTDYAPNPEIILVSVYSDINKETISSELNRVVHY